MPAGIEDVEEFESPPMRRPTRMLPVSLEFEECMADWAVAWTPNLLARGLIGGGVFLSV